jgi:5-methylcytosine-specific restriction enzyme subunit McrC
LVHRLEMPTEGEGDHALAALLKNEIVFHLLFERFVRNFYHLHLTDYRVVRENLEWYDELGSGFVPAMQTDITLIGKLPPHRRVVIDTKYSVTTLSDRLKFKSENLYQIYAYLRTEEHRNETYRQAEGMLLYPTTTHQVDGEMLVQGHRIRVVTVNLAEPWEQIEEHLLGLAPLVSDAAHGKPLATGEELKDYR